MDGCMSIQKRDDINYYWFLTWSKVPVNSLSLCFSLAPFSINIFFFPYWNVDSTFCIHSSSTSSCACVFENDRKPFIFGFAFSCSKIEIENTLTNTEKTPLMQILWQTTMNCKFFMWTRQGASCARFFLFYNFLKCSSYMCK